MKLGTKVMPLVDNMSQILILKNQ